MADRDFGPNDWLVDEMYERYRENPSSVSESWQEFFEDYRPRAGDGAASTASTLAPAGPEAPQVHAPPGDVAATATTAGTGATTSR